MTKVLFDKNIHILIAESHEIIRIGLRSLIEEDPLIKIVAESDDIDEVQPLVAAFKPDVLLLDLLLSNNELSRIIPKLTKTYPLIKILIFSNDNELDTHLQVLRSGAAGVISKDQNATLLLKAIHSVHAGHEWFDRQLTKLLWQSAEQQLSNNGNVTQKILTEREFSVARIACQGLSAKRIGKELGISEKTVRNQLSIIYEKLGVVSQVDLCLKADQFGLDNSDSKL